jgi:hypothetical protein
VIFERSEAAFIADRVNRETSSLVII